MQLPQFAPDCKKFVVGIGQKFDDQIGNRSDLIHQADRLTGHQRTVIHITVNGSKTEDYVVPETGNAWEGDTKTYTLDITLNAGDNTITFGQNEGALVPNLDYIQIEAIPCPHANTKVEGAKEATQDAEGYTGDTVCADCGEIIARGEVVPKIPAPVPTGDAALAISALVLLAAAGAVMIARKRKIEE